MRCCNFTVKESRVIVYIRRPWRRRTSLYAQVVLLIFYSSGENTRAPLVYVTPCTGPGESWCGTLDKLLASTLSDTELALWGPSSNYVTTVPMFHAMSPPVAGCDPSQTGQGNQDSYLPPLRFTSATGAISQDSYNIHCGTTVTYAHKDDARAVGAMIVARLSGVAISFICSRLRPDAITRRMADIVWYLVNCRFSVFVFGWLLNFRSRGWPLINAGGPMILVYWSSPGRKRT
ncbi:hypothetical protein OF83DRAFT_314572 [Amylostereum chailletii]|nr:hypothetical protein OF83DRAFT_314572 [Amylostereum chailletii]